MVKSRCKSTVCGLLLAICSVALARPLHADAASEAPQYKQMPWHLMDSWWDVGSEVPFESLSMDINVSDDVPAEVRLYLAPIGLGTLGDQNFYGGLQTQSDGNTKADRRLRGIGRGLLLSMWGERAEAAIRPSLGGFWQSSGHEGDFVSVRRPYDWTKGDYTYRLVRMDEELIDGKPHTWVGAFLYSHEKDENIFIGALRFRGNDLKLGRRVANFVEIYGPEIPTEKIPKVVVTFGNMRVNGKPIEKPACDVIYPQGVPDFAAAKAVGRDQIAVTVGEEVKDRTNRRETMAFE